MNHLGTLWVKAAVAVPVSDDLPFPPPDERHPKEAFLSVFIDNYLSPVCRGKMPGRFAGELQGVERREQGPAAVGHCQ